eukprot:symbB.v1.2.006900.t1/scaffold418.1/size208590/4
MVFEIMSNRSFVIAGLCAGVVICICGLCWEFRNKSTDGVDVELGGDDLDEVWFRKPEQHPVKRASSKMSKR